MPEEMRGQVPARGDEAQNQILASHTLTVCPWPATHGMVPLFTFLLGGDTTRIHFMALCEEKENARAITFDKACDQGRAVSLSLVRDA